jgi:hypothetical protein
LRCCARATSWRAFAACTPRLAGLRMPFGEIGEMIDRGKGLTLLQSILRFLQAVLRSPQIVCRGLLRERLLRQGLHLGACLIELRALPGCGGTGSQRTGDDGKCNIASHKYIPFDIFFTCHWGFVCGSGGDASGGGGAGGAAGAGGYAWRSERGGDDGTVDRLPSAER